MISPNIMDLIDRAYTDILTEWWLSLSDHRMPKGLEGDTSDLMRLIESTVGRRALDQARRDRKRDSVWY
jgi:hypothetical protein